ncbi:MAG TPA: hypothetical protein VF119_04695 [Candidatus Limnocylindrales bacterium]
MERGTEVSMPSGSDPIDRLRAADPVRAEDLPDASLARVTANVQEHMMTQNRYDPTVRPPRRPLAFLGGLALVGAFALAIAVGTGSIGGGDPGPIGAAPTPTENPAAGGGMASCLVYDPANIPAMDVAFDGTVTAIEGDQVTFTVNTGWKGADGTITLTKPDADPALVGPLPEFAVGERYLVTASGDTINACGYTVDYDEATAESWAQAFAAS